MHLHASKVHCCASAVNTLSTAWLLIMKCEEYLIGILVCINGPTILNISQGCGHYLVLSICNESAYFTPQPERSHSKCRLILDFTLPFHINRKSNDQSSWTRAAGRSSNFSSEIHLTRVLSLIYSAALPRADAPHLRVPRRTTDSSCNGKGQKAAGPAHHLSQPQRAELWNEFLHWHNHVLIDD